MDYWPPFYNPKSWGSLKGFVKLVNNIWPVFVIFAGVGLLVYYTLHNPTEPRYYEQETYSP